MSETRENSVTPEAEALASAIVATGRELGRIISDQPLIQKLSRFKELCQSPAPQKLAIALAEKSRAMAVQGYVAGSGKGCDVLRLERAGMREAIGVLYGAEALRVAGDLCRIFDKLYAGEVPASGEASAFAKATADETAGGQEG